MTSTSDFDAIVFCQKTAVNLGDLLTQSKEFSCLSFSFMSDGKMEQKMGRWFGVVLWTVVVKKVLSNQAKLLVFSSVYV